MAINDFNPCLIFADTADYETLLELLAPGLSLIVRLGCKWVTVANTLTYYLKELITGVKSFMVWLHNFTSFICVVNGGCTVVKHLTSNLKIKGLNSTAETGKEKNGNLYELYE